MRDYSPWERCADGHDLTQANAFLYLSGGNRMCRICAVSKGKTKPRTKDKVDGSFQN